ncbi:MAG: DUF3426 domain-containing protein [Alphaproteobacteria bacterium]|nr:DUF3426 domain-containing protein [Alphaproteobacteria bacterium]
MKLQSRCPHCHQIEPIQSGIDTQSARACPSCGLRYVPQRHLFVADEITDVRIALRDDPLPAGSAVRAIPKAPHEPVESLPRTRRNRLRAGLILVLGLLLLIQISLHHRNLWSARWPWCEPLLRALCQPLNCRIQPPEMLSAISVVSSGFDQKDSGDFVFSLHLRNDLTHIVATPAIELILTDSYDRPVLRKVLLPDNLGLSQALSPGHGIETETRMLLEADLHNHINGFRVEVFYP